MLTGIFVIFFFYKKQSRTVTTRKRDFKNGIFYCRIILLYMCRVYSNCWRCYVAYALQSATEIGEVKNAACERILTSNRRRWFYHVLNLANGRDQLSVVIYKFVPTHVPCPNFLSHFEMKIKSAFNIVFGGKNHTVVDTSLIMR